MVSGIPSTAKAVKAAATRADLLAVARQLFAERGFAGTSTEEIVQAAQVTRGALYYHFRSKEDLFRAVFEAVEEDLNIRVTGVATAAGEPWPALLAGCAAFLDACLDPSVQRIALLDAPSVLGWEEWRQIGSQHSFGLLATGLQWAIVAGDVEDQPVAALAHVLLGALNEAALFIARADDPPAARRDVGEVLARLLDSLRPA